MSFPALPHLTGTTAGPFLSLQQVRALACSADGPGCGEPVMRIQTSSSLVGGPVVLTGVQGASRRGAACEPLESLAAASAAFRRALTGLPSGRQDLRAYHRVLDVQLDLARKHCPADGQLSPAFRSFLSAADAYLGKLRRWVPEEPDDGPETLRLARRK